MRFQRTSSFVKAAALVEVTLVTSTIFFLSACGGGGSSVQPSSAKGPTGCAQSVAAPAVATNAARAGSIGLHWATGESESVAPGSVAIRFAGSRITSEAAAALSRLGAVQASDLNDQGAATFSIPSSSDPRAVAKALQGVRGVLASGPVIYRHTLGNPNDPLFVEPNQWDLFAMQMPAAWGITLGGPALRIAIIDTGYDATNPDLAGKVDATAVFDLGNGKRDTCGSIEDKDGHGSDVSGIASADTNNGIDVAGTAWNVHLIEARVFPYGKNPGASTQDIAAAINWAVANGAKVINLSLGSGSPDNTFEEPAVASAISHGVIVVAAAGNEGKNIIDFPAADPGVIAVGASAYHDVTQNVLTGGHEYVAAYSNYGSALALVAPGGDPSVAQTQCTTQACIDYLQWIENLDSLQGQFKEQVGLFAGTSQAAPHVAGAVALMASKDPALTPAQARSIVRTSADNISDPHQGAGRLNVLNALNQTP